ncbi:DUF4157 domain-containing protein [Microbacterium pumilum]|uniref:eCIS core domain-containing protein n=1 Tax=Microbacterium pumilum TaxID=344165 RepID=A0ABN2T5E8_9MICO
MLAASHAEPARRGAEPAGPPPHREHERRPAPPSTLAYELSHVVPPPSHPSIARSHGSGLKNRPERGPSASWRPAGAPLASGTRADMESHLGVDLAGVRVDTSPRAAADAAAIGALAFTRGTDIAFARGRFAPSTTEGRRLLAHELRHASADAHDGLLHLAADPERVAERVSTSSESGGVPAASAVTADQWLQTNSLRLVRELASWLVGVRLNPPLMELHWHRSSEDFVRSLMDLAGSTADDATRSLTAWLRPDRLSDAVNVGRDVAVLRFGSPLYEQGVREEVGRRLVARILESFQRVAPRVARDAARAWTPGSPGFAPPLQIDLGKVLTVPLGSPTLFFYLGPAPTAGGSFRHPLDQPVYLSLRTTVDVEAALWRAEHPEEFTPEAIERDAAQLREVSLEYLGGQGLPSWVRATPADATAEEVAFALYGLPEAATRLTPAAPLWGLPAEDIPLAAIPEAPSLPIPGVIPKERDTVPLRATVHSAMFQANRGSPTETQLLDTPFADTAAIGAASKIRPTPGANDLLILERLSAMVDLLDDIADVAGELMRPPSASRVAYVIGTTGLTTVPWDPPETVAMRARAEHIRARVARRRESLVGVGGIVALWDGQTAGQLDIMLKVTQGLHTAAAIARRFAGWPAVYKLIQDVATGYIEAAEVSDLYDLGRARLAAAERRSVLFPVTAMELWLAQIRAILDEARKSEVAAVDPGDPGLTRDVYRMDAIDADLRSRLAAVRTQLIQDPAQAETELMAIFGSLQSLQTGASVALNLDTVDRVWQALYDSLSIWGALRGAFPGKHGNEIVEDALAETLVVQGEWEEILGVWRSGEHDRARTLLDKKAKGTWLTWVHKMQSTVEDQQAWDRLMTFAALVGIAVLSGGIGAYVEAAAGTAWGVGTAAGTVWAELGAAGVGTLAEATVFTGLSYPMTARSPSVGEFGEQFATNFLFIGGARVLGAGFEALAGVERSASTLGRVTKAGLQGGAMLGANLVLANREAQHRRGEGLTSQEVASISLENAAFLGLVTVANGLLRSPLRNLRLAGRMHVLELRHQRTLAALDVTMKELPSGRVPEEISRRLAERVERALTAEDALAAELASRVSEADALPQEQREAALRRWGIDATTAEHLRRGAVRSQVLSNLHRLQGIRITRSLRPLGTDFTVDSAMYGEALDWFRSRPDTTVVSAEGSSGVVEPGRGSVQLILNQPTVRPLSAARSFVVSALGEASFRVIERIGGATGELAPHVELARSAGEVAAERGPIVRPSSASGGRAFADPVRWGLPAEAIQALRTRLLASTDLGAVQRTAAEGGLNVGQATLKRVKSYLFDSAGIDFLPENVQWWRRLATGRASVHDISILVHEVAENRRLERVRGQTGFDYMGERFEGLSRSEQQYWRADFNRIYEEAHRGALEDEYNFVADQVKRLTNNRVVVRRNQVAAVDPTRDEGRRYILQDGIPLQQHSQFADWVARGQAEVEIGTSAAEKLRLFTTHPTLRELVGAVKRHGGFAPMALEGGGAGGARTGEVSVGRRGGAAWDPSKYTSVTLEGILTLPFADGATIGRELFGRGRDLLVRATGLTPTQKADAFEQLAQRINRVDPSWMARRSPATNAAGFFTGEGRPFGFAVDHDGVIRQTDNVGATLKYGPNAVVTIDFSTWQRRSP